MWLGFFSNGCKNYSAEDHIRDDLSVTEYSDATGRYYEETSSGYRAALYQKDEINVETIKNWLSTCDPSNSYYEFTYSDPDSWDMFIYYSPIDEGISCEGFRFSVVDSTVHIFVTSGGATSGENEDYLLIKVQAPLRGAWPNTSELFIDDVQIGIESAQFIT